MVCCCRLFVLLSFSHLLLSFDFSQKIMKDNRHDATAVVVACCIFDDLSFFSFCFSLYRLLYVWFVVICSTFFVVTVPMFCFLLSHCFVPILRPSSGVMFVSLLFSLFDFCCFLACLSGQCRSCSLWLCCCFFLFILTLVHSVTSRD